MTIIDRIDCAATRAQLIAMATVQDMGRAMTAGPVGEYARRGVILRRARPPSSTRLGLSPPRDSRACSS